MGELVSRLARVMLPGLALLIAAFLVLPALIVVPLSFSNQTYLSFPPPGWSLKWYEAMTTDLAWPQAAVNSFFIGVPTALLSSILGTMAALAVARGRIAWAATASAVIVAPMLLPHIIMAIGLYPVMLDLGLLRGYLGVIVSHTVVAMPLVFITVSASLRTYPETLEMAAMTCGASPWPTFRYVTLPMIRPGVMVGAVLAFATSFDELMLSLFLTGPGTRTLPRLIWEQMNMFLTPTIAAVATLIFAFSLLLLGLVALLQNRAGANPSFARE
ncbi:MAG: ABC transporter permease [Alphaproteobacteria bacterium]|nr:ABC transporter permease [Alphaproteobacteria bacterium]